MPILVDCPICRRKLRVPDAAAGRRGRCPRCASEIEVPGSVEDLPAFLPVDEGYALIPDPIEESTPSPLHPLPEQPRSVPWRFGFAARSPAEFESSQRVVVIDVDMPLGSMISLLFRWTVAALIVWAAFAAVFLVIGLGLSLLLASIGLNPGHPRR